MVKQMPHEFDAGMKVTRNGRFSQAVFNSYDIPFDDIYESLIKQGYIPGVHIKTVVFDLAGKDVDRDAIKEAAETLNEGRAYVRFVGDFMVIFLYTKVARDFTTISHDRIMSSLDETIHRPFDVLCGISQMFEDLHEAGSAFKQALYALEYRDFYRREMRIMREEHYEEIAAGAAFEQVVPYYLVEESCVDTAFVDFCLSQAFLTTILADDIRNNTKNFQILWFYLAYECNASSVGRRMFMHRNSVLYHLKQMERRYDFSLERRYFREKLMLDFRLVFMNLSEASLNTLFEN